MEFVLPSLILHCETVLMSCGSFGISSEMCTTVSSTRERLPTCLKSSWQLMEFCSLAYGGSLIGLMILEND